MLFLRRSDKHSVTLLKRQIFLCPRPYSWRTGTLGFMERLEIVHELKCINRNRRMLRQTLRSFESLITMTHHCHQTVTTAGSSWGNSLAWPFQWAWQSKSSVQHQAARKFCESREAKVVLFKIESLLGSSRNVLCVLFGRLCTESNSSFIFATTNYVKVKSPWNLFFSCAYRCY